MSFRNKYETPQIARHACKYQTNEHKKFPTNSKQKTNDVKEISFQKEMINKFLLPATS